VDEGPGWVGKPQDQKSKRKGCPNHTNGSGKKKRTYKEGTSQKRHDKKKIFVKERQRAIGMETKGGQKEQTLRGRPKREGLPHTKGKNCAGGEKGSTAKNSQRL